MLQGNLTKLDNDFITIWSNYMLYREIDKDALKALAEMGQINAVQSFYLFFFRKDRSPKVDEIVENYKGINPDEDFAKANKLRFDKAEDIVKVDKLILAISEIEDDINELQRKYDNTLIVEYAEQRDIERQANRKFEQKKELEKDFYNISFIKLKKECIGEYWNIGLQTKNPLFCERAVELQRSMPMFDLADLRKCVKITRKGLMKAYKKDKEDTLVQFALGKNLLMFRGSDKEKELGNLLLKNLASRELSKETQEYKANLNLNGEKE